MISQFTQEFAENAVLVINIMEEIQKSMNCNITFDLAVGDCIGYNMRIRASFDNGISVYLYIVSNAILTQKSELESAIRLLYNQEVSRRLKVKEDLNVGAD